jgi:single-strand DNA-binding protein
MKETLMIDSIATSGLIATEPQHTVTSDGVARTSFRLASSPRKFNRTTKTWEYGPTNWFTVTAFRHLALNLSRSIHKGERILVMGRMRVREWKKDERGGIVVEITADAVGHDLTWGTAAYERNIKSVAIEAAPGSTGQPMAFDPDEHASPGTEGERWAASTEADADDAASGPDREESYDAGAQPLPSLAADRG